MYNLQLQSALFKLFHPKSIVCDDEVFSKTMTKAKRKHLYKQVQANFTSGGSKTNFFESFFDLATELMRRLKKVKKNIRSNERLLSADGFRDILFTT